MYMLRGGEYYPEVKLSLHWISCCYVCLGLSGKYYSNDTDTTHYDSLQKSYWADQKDSHNAVIMTFIQGQYRGPMKGLGIL